MYDILLVVSKKMRFLSSYTFRIGLKDKKRFENQEMSSKKVTKKVTDETDEDAGKVLNPFEHALKRPDSVIGSKATVKREMYIYNEAADKNNDEDSEAVVLDEDGNSVKESSPSQIILQKVKYNQGLLRIFIEAMSNAIDNLWRSSKNGVTMRKIDFTLDNDPESETYGWITVVNDGYCIPVEKKKYVFTDQRTKKVRTEMLYPAEVFFGEMHAGTNFENDDKRKTSGRNGMGGKAIVIFSKEVVIDHANPEQKKRFVQNYRENGTDRDEPVITSYKNRTGYTSISFLPDYAYFGYPGMDEDLFALLKRYVYESSMITGLAVTLNEKKIVVKDLPKYVRLYYPNAKEHCMISFKAPNGDECVLIEKGMTDRDIDDDISQVSWINGINTRDGGIHVEAWKAAILPALVKAFNARKPKKGEKEVLKASAKEIYPYLTLFVRAEAEGAMFNGQTKDMFTELPGNVTEVTLAPDKKQKIEFTKTIAESLKKILKWNFVALLEEKLAMKAERAQAKKETVTKKRMAFGDKAEDANFAGTKRAAECTLWVTEGKSAKTFATRIISGLPNGTDLNGVLALKGKFINTLNASPKEVRANQEVEMFKEIMRLMTNADYNDPDMRKTLRYGRIVIACDQDDDGFHIKGLFLLFLWKFWPSLFDLTTIDGTCFVCSISTAVVMARAGKGKNATLKMFYSNPEFKAWYESGEFQSGKYKLKYYKGLGTHMPGDEKLYNDDPKRIQYVLDGDEPDYMDLGFDKKQSNWRKTWITRDLPKPGEMTIAEETAPITIDGELSLSTFVDTQLKIYHVMALRRALPNIYDGFKESQRKAFYGILIDQDARKEAQNLENLAGSVKKATGYHHGGESLENTIKKMAQGFVGSNNIPPFTNEGEFGTRGSGGADAAAARYVSTRLEDITRVLFSEMDEPILRHAVEDDKEVEFEFLMPILPTILINGAKGIASGYSTDIPCYNPLDLDAWVVAWLHSEDGKVDLPPLKPWYRGYKGTIELLRKVGKQYKICEPGEKATSWRTKGILEQTKGGWWRISELPIGLWTETMKEYLEYLYTGQPPKGSKKKKGDRYLSDIRWKGTVNTAVWDIKPVKDFIPDMEVTGNFKILQSTFSLTNMHVIDENNYPRKYSSPEDLLQDFCAKRYEYYEKRKSYWTREYQKQYDKESDRYKYVQAVIDGRLAMKQDDAKLEAAMIKLGLRKAADKKGKVSFDYLLSMQMRSIMSVNKLEEIKREVVRLKALLDNMKAKSATDLWLDDLVKFREAYAIFLKTRKEEA